MDNFIPGLILTILIVFPSLVMSTDVQVTGPDEVFTGDSEKFTCNITGDDVIKEYGYN